jgi:signal transduction histidine kinase
MNESGLKLRVLLRTSTFQFAMMYALMFAVSVLVLFGILYWWTNRDLNRQIDAAIEAEISGLVEQYERLGIGGLISVVAERSARDSVPSSVYLFVDGNLRPLAGNLNGWPVGLKRTGRWVEFERATESGSAVPVRAMVLSVGNDLRLLVGRDIRDQEQLNRVFARSASLGIAIVLLLALSGGLLMSIGAQRRVSAINRTARQIMGGDLSQRVALSGTRDEFDELAVNINAMLNQIENLLDGMRHVGDSIAHDLKTPLTRLRNRLERLAVGEPGNPDGLKQCVEESDRLLATFNALLRISRIESGAYRAAFAEFDLAEMVRDICDIYQPAADEREIALHCRGQHAVRLYGDRELLAQGLTNLLDNAIKYTPRGGQVEVGAYSKGKLRRLVVSDSGPGVPDDEIDNLHRRFVRLDNARTEPGNGLGLALVHAVVEQHHGKLVIENRHPGLEVRLELPETPAHEIPQPMQTGST